MADLTLHILPQPDDSTCGPTCLHAVYGFHGASMDLHRVIAEVTPLATGGTLSVFLGIHGLRRGFEATIYTYNLEIFDPTWFDKSAGELAGLLRQQAEVKGSARLRLATSAYVDFLERGGVIRHQELRPDLIRRHLMDGHPILTGLSATYLYACAREVDEAGRLRYDSVRGEPTGHFVVLHGYDADTDSVLVADPLHENAFGSHNYRVGMLRLLGAIMLGVLTYDGNLLVIAPRAQEDA
ncbi:MAG TPA: C39 family peptidase [Longimicrobiales bacterium]|nr:C39 family peptidase [Longimicrobiales bacterium]